MQILLQALINAHGNPTTIGNTWATRLTLTAADNIAEFCAVLGTPNGSGGGYLLLTHKALLGLKKITQVDIYAAEGPYIVVGSDEDDVEEAESAQIVLVFTVKPV
jgi:hypothetical protein